MIDPEEIGRHYIVKKAKEITSLTTAEYLNDQGHGEWMTYADIDGSIGAVTGEDFVKKSAITKAINAVAQGMPEFSDADLPTDNNKLQAITGWLKKNGLQQQQVKATLSSIKTHVFANLTAVEIEPEYSKILKGLSAHLQPKGAALSTRRVNEVAAE